jgi:hypothetical protein
MPKYELQLWEREKSSSAKNKKPIINVLIKFVG